LTNINIFEVKLKVKSWIKILLGFIVQHKFFNMNYLHD
jgi:hypothetical protein